MSHYCTVKTRFTDEASLVEALQQVKNAYGKQWTRDEIEVHTEPQRLRGGYSWESAHVIVRQNFEHGDSDDIGFVRQEDGTYRAIISKYDKACYGEAWLQQLTQQYAVARTVKQLQTEHRTFKKTFLEDGRVRIEVDVPVTHRY